MSLNSSCSSQLSRREWVNPLQRMEVILFLAAFFTYAYFNQGGGWNQNARFAEARAIVEQGRFAIDDYLVYDRPAAGSATLQRAHVEKGDLQFRGERVRLGWPQEQEGLRPINGQSPEPGRRLVSVEEVVCSGDIGFWRGHFHPNKAPGLGFLAAVAYFPIYHLESLCGINPDSSWTLTCNLWLTTICVSGLISALAVVFFFRTALLLAPGAERAALLATAGFAFGTMFFPYATILFDNNPAGALLLISFYLIFKQVREGRHAPGLFIVSGFCAGFAAVSNYVAALAVALIGLYVLVKCPRKAAVVWFGIGVCVPLLVIVSYCWLCFGRVFAFNTDFQNPVFKDQGGALLGMFGLPHPEVIVYLLFSPFRGIFYTAPILLLGFYGLWLAFRERGFAPEAILFLLLFLVFFAVNLSFNGWHGGFTSEARYLGPAMPFLMLPVVFAFGRFPRACVVLTVVSITIQFIITAVDVESPAGTGSLAMVGRRLQCLHDPFGQYAAPIFFTGRAWPILDQMIEENLIAEDASLAAAGVDPEKRKAVIDALRPLLIKAVRMGDPQPFLLATFDGPVSVNPVGPYEAEFYHLFRPGSVEVEWNSFNLGEIWFPASRTSLLPLGLVLLGLGGAAARLAGIGAKRTAAESPGVTERAVF